MLRSDAKLPNEFLGICAAALFPLATWVSGISGVVVVFAIFVLTLLVWYVFWQPARISDVAVSLFGAVYTGVIMSCAMLLRVSLPEFWGAVLVLGLFASVWGNDAFAYLVGSAIGKHKLAPHTPPQKKLGRLHSRPCCGHGVLVLAHAYSRGNHVYSASIGVRLDKWAFGCFGRLGGKPHQTQFRLQGFGHHYARSWRFAR